MKTVNLFVLLILNSLLCSSQNADSPISFRNFILDKTSYNESLLILKNSTDFKYEQIKEYNNGYYYWLNDVLSFPVSGFADNSLIEQFKLKTYDADLKLKSISCITNLLETECEMQLYFYNNILCAVAVVLNTSTSSFQLEQQLDDKYGKHSIQGYYDYPNIQQDWHTSCINWCYKKDECEKAPIEISDLYNVCDIFKYNKLSSKFIDTKVLDKVLSYRGKINYKSYLDYKSVMEEKAKIDLGVLKKQKKPSI